MKKEYMKPQIMFESFAMSANIAAGCEIKTSTASLNQCGLEAEGVGVVFLTGMTGCGFQVQESTNGTPDFNGICYHVPVDTNNLFNS